MRAGRGAGCVVKPVRPVGVFASRNLPGLTLASSRSELRMLMSDSACLSDLRKWTCRGWSPIAHGQVERALDVDASPIGAGGPMPSQSGVRKLVQGLVLPPNI